MSLFDKIFRRNRPPSTSVTFEDLWDRLVPTSGQAETVQGELIRAVGRMQDEFVRNGYGNWDNGYEILSTHALTCLSDGSFGPTKTEGIKTDIAAIQRYGRGEKVDHDLEAAHERLCDAAVDWCIRHPESIRHQRREDLKR